MTLRHTSNGVITPHVLNHIGGRGHFHDTGISAPGEKPPNSFGQGTGWILAPVSLLWRNKSLYPLSIIQQRFLDHRVTIPAIVQQLLGVQ